MQAGTRVGPYVIVEPIGAGGMGEVYRARDAKLGREVALKVLPTAVAADPDRLSRFDREARLLATLNHPNIGAIYGLESLSSGDAGSPVLVLELIEGPTLSEHIPLLPRGQARVRAALEIARQIAEALDAAHERGVIHRDLKPGNVKITPDGQVKVLDFGLAKSQTESPSVDSSNSPTVTVDGTDAGVILGTAVYMSPEQTRGRQVDKRTDIWSFGCVLYEMLTGTRAFKGETTSDLIAAILETKPDLSRLPAGTPASVTRLLRRCFEKDPRRRLRDIADARADIEDELSVQAAARESRRVSLVPTWLVVLIALLAIGGPAIAWFAALRSIAPPPPAFDHVARIVATGAHEYAPVLSPDGKWIAYLSNARGPTDVWVKFLAGGDPANLTASSKLTIQSTDYVSGIAVSPDGTQIAFTAVESLSRASTWVIPAPLGGVPRRVLPDGNYGLDWSPDGKHIVFIRAGGPLGDALVVADADGQHETVIAKRQGAQHIHWPRWSGDGKYIYFNHGPQNFNIEPTAIFRIPSGGGPIEPVIATARRAAFPFSNRDGTALVYAANPDTVDLNIWWRDLKTGRDTRLTSGIGEYTHPALSADGRMIVGTVLDSRQSLKRIAVQFDSPPQVEDITDGRGGSGDFDPASSPDGTQLVFSSSRTGNRNLWVMQTGSIAPAPLTSGVAIDERPAISPDGKQVAFVSDRSGSRGIWLIATEGGTPRFLVKADVVDTLSWSPDGSQVVFATPTEDAPGLMVVSVADGKTTTLKTPSAATGPTWSRDGVIAFIEPHGGAIGAFAQLIRPNGERVSSAPLDAAGSPQMANGSLVWSPDGTRIAAASLPGAGLGSLWIIDPARPKPYRKLLDLPSGIFTRGLTWSHDGKSLTFGTYQWSGDIFLAERSAPR
jgi:serine/threonine protein kinase/Tol biopolymer transport system component